MKFSSFVLAIAALTSNVALAQSLWGGTRSGMTPDEAKQVQPVAFSPPNPGKVAQTGDVELLRVEGLDVGAGATFKASMYFSKMEQLQQVTLAPMVPVNAYAGKSMFDRLLLGLNAKYGNPMNMNLKVDQAEATWILDKTKISLFFMNFMGSVTIIQVVYTGDAKALGSGL